MKKSAPQALVLLFSSIIILLGWTRSASAEVATDSTLKHSGSFIVGQVVNDMGQGVAEVKVHDYTSNDSAVTDAQGHFSLPYRKKTGCQWRLLFASTETSFGCADFKNAPSQPTRGGSPSDTIKLVRRTDILQGKLIDGAGRPISNAKIRLSAIEMGQTVVSTSIDGEDADAAQLWDLLSAPSELDGSFHFSLPAGSKVGFSLSAPGFGRLQFLRFETATNDVGTLTLPDGGDIHGRLVDATTGKPLSSRVVRANRKSSNDDLGTVDNHLQDGFLGWTDQDGNFRFNSVRVGTYDVSVERTSSNPQDTLVPGPAATVQIKAGTTAVADLSMIRGQLVTGRVLFGNTNQPVRQESAIELLPGQYYGQYFYTRADGTFSTYLLPGNYQFKLNDGSDEFAPVDVVVAANAVTPPVTLRAADDVTTVVIKARSADGKPLPIPDTTWGYVWVNGQARNGSSTSDNATFIVKKDSRPVFIMDRPGYAVWQSPLMDVSRSLGPIDAVLQPAAQVAVKGRIVDSATGKPMPGVLVFPTEFLDGGIHWRRFIFPMSTDQDGRFTLSGFPVGDRIRLEANLSGRGNDNEIVVADDPSGMFDQKQVATDGITLSLGRGPLQLADTRVDLRPLGNVADQNFDQHPLPPLPGTKPPPILPPAPPFGGIGVILHSMDSQTVISDVLPDSPAVKVGLRSGDLILVIDGKPIQNMHDAERLARGPVGTKVHLQIKRGDVPQNLELTRSTISPPAIPLSGITRSSLDTGHDFDPDALAQITLPPQPTKDEVRHYLRRIAQASLGLRRSSSTDPQVEMIERVGHDNVDLLLQDHADFVGSLYWSMDLYIQMALEDLVTDADRDLIIDHLNSRIDLMPIVVKHHWQDAAKPAIVAALQGSPERFRYSWFPVAAGYHDPALYPGLAKVFVQSPNKFMNFQTLQKVPGFDLQSAVDRAWAKEVTGTSYLGIDRQEGYGMAVIAAQYGHLDALDYLCEALAAHSTVYNSWPDPRTAILSVVNFNGTNDEILGWYRNNKSHLKFDATLKKFIPS